MIARCRPSSRLISPTPGVPASMTSTPGGNWRSSSASITRQPTPSSACSGLPRPRTSTGRRTNDEEPTFSFVLRPSSSRLSSPVTQTSHPENGPSTRCTDRRPGPASPRAAGSRPAAWSRICGTSVRMSASMFARFWPVGMMQLAFVMQPVVVIGVLVVEDAARHLGRRRRRRPGAGTGRRWLAFTPRRSSLVDELDGILHAVHGLDHLGHRDHERVVARRLQPQRARRRLGASGRSWSGLLLKRASAPTM